MYYRRHAKGNKFGAVKTVYNGVTYDSKKEGKQALELDLLKKARDEKQRVKEWERQIPFDFVVNGEKIGRYIADFKVIFCDGRVEYWDVKGYKKGTAYSFFRMKTKLVKALYGIDIKVV